MMSYLVGFAVIGLGMMTAGFNLAVTIINYRPRDDLEQDPIFVWSILATCALLTLATPTLVAAGLFGILDHTAQTAFYVTEHGGSSFLWQNLFWFFGHPRSTSWPCRVSASWPRSFRCSPESLSSRTRWRRPGWSGSRCCPSSFGSTTCSRAGSTRTCARCHVDHGVDLDPTGFISCGDGHSVQAKIRFEVPMLFCLAVFFNFLIGGVTGVFLSDVPVNVTVHGSFFVLAHFHYTIMGGLIFAFFAGLYFWLPKMTGKTLNKRLGKIHFWCMFVFFNMTFFPMFLIGLLGQPRRVFEYAQNLQALNDFASVSAFLLGASFLIFIANFVWSIFIKPIEASTNPWNSLGLEWQTPTPVPSTTSNASLWS